MVLDLNERLHTLFSFSTTQSVQFHRFFWGDILPPSLLATYLILLLNYTVGSIPQVFLRRYSTSIPVLGAMEDLIAKIPLRSLFSKVRGLRVRFKKEEVIWFFFFLGLLFCLVRLFATPSSLWDLVPQPRIEPVPLAVKVQSPNSWTTREFPYGVILNSFVEI